jgi:two-component system NtrC family sensor kinase
MNLFNNARDAISGAGSIKITAQRLGQYVELRIKDSGGGMDQDTLAHLPEPFFSTKEKGTGLGIHICHTIIHAHGGELRFESQKGIGTTAVILLPIKETTA